MWMTDREKSVREPSILELLRLKAENRQLKAGVDGRSCWCSAGVICAPCYALLYPDLYNNERKKSVCG